MNEKRFKSTLDEETMSIMPYLVSDKEEECFYNLQGCVDLLNKQQELIEELHTSDHMGWERADYFEKELKQKKIYIKRLEYKVQKFKEENKQLKKQLSKYDKPKISIFNKDKGDWKWNDNNDLILNLRTGNKFYLRNSGAVENLVGLLNEQEDELKLLRATNVEQYEQIQRLLKEVGE